MNPEALIMLIGAIALVWGGLVAAAVGAHRRRTARRALLAQIAVVAQQTVIEPIAAQLDEARRFDAARAVAVRP